MWHYDSGFFLFMSICVVLSGGQELDCKWDIHDCKQAEVICNPQEMIHLDTKGTESNQEHCLAIQDNEKGEFENYDIRVDMLSLESKEGTNSGNVGIIFNYLDNSNYEFVYLE